MSIHKSAQISPDVNLILGHGAMIGEDVVISGKGTLTIGDYVKIHRLTWINCYSDIDIGHNSWIGEKSILDGTARLKLGNNVAIGTGSQVWTHISFGDAFSGCRLRTSREIVLDDESWLAGPVILQAANLTKRVVVLAGSNVVKDITEPNTIWTGNPIQNVTDSMGGPPWMPVTVEHKKKHFERLLRMYERETKRSRADVFVCVDSIPLVNERREGVSYFDVNDRVYTKTQLPEEKHFMQWLLRHNKAKFTPVP